MKQALENYQLFQTKKENPIHRIADAYYKLKNWTNMPRDFYKGARAYGTVAKYAKIALEVFGSEEKVLSALSQLDRKSKSEGWEYSMATLTSPKGKFKL